MTITSEMITSKPWFSNLEKGQQDLFLQGLQLFEREKQLASQFDDYSFILFPFSKAYEGFLKQFFYQQGLISERVYQGRRFRIGRSLNPDIRDQHKDEWWLYDDVSHRCGEEVARDLWNVWIECRNHIFHYFPNDIKHHNLDSIEVKIEKMLDVVERAWQCKVVEGREQ